MIRCEVTREFTLGKFDELKNIIRKNIDTYGKLYIGDTFECTEEMAKYLTGDNANKDVVVKVLEVIPDGEIIYSEEKLEPTVKFTKYSDDKTGKKTIKSNKKANKK